MRQEQTECFLLVPINSATFVMFNLLSLTADTLGHHRVKQKYFGQFLL